MLHSRAVNLVEAIRQGLEDAMAEDPAVVLLGEDVGRLGGVFRASEGLLDRFGPDRVLDTPLNETGIVGAAIGMALTGLRPVAEIQFADFVFPAFDQIVNELAKIRFRSAGQWTAPVVLRMPVGAGVGGGPYHSQSPEAHFVHTPGLRVVCPSTPADGYGLVRSALRCPDPVVILEPKQLYRSATGSVPPGHRTPLDQLREVRPGAEITVLSWGRMVPMCEAAITESGVDAHLLDARVLAPLDAEPILDSVRRTGRCLIVQEAPRSCGVGAEIMARVVEGCFFHLEAQPVRLTGADAPVGYAHEADYFPSVPQIAEALAELARSRA